MFLKGRNYCDYFVASEIGGGLFLLSVKLPVVAAAAALVVCLCVVVFFPSSQTLHNAKLLSKKELIAPDTVRGLRVPQTRSK